jgi:DNA primase
MPIDWLVDYWQAKAEATLPFLAGRAVAMQLRFDDHIVFRRHNTDGSFVHVESSDDLLHWARQHCYSFHPHLEGDPFLFALDIDRRSEDMPLQAVNYCAQELAALLAELDIRFLLKFSGRRGFHFFWGFAPSDLEQAAGQEPWEFERAIIRGLRRRLEERLQAGTRAGELYALLGLEPDMPLTVTNSADKAHERSVLLDENIVHHLGSLRSPWSVHPESGLVSLPLKVEELAGFQPEQASPQRALERDGPRAIPLNAAAALAELARDAAKH